jgi:hypothetical protein
VERRYGNCGAGEHEAGMLEVKLFYTTPPCTPDEDAEKIATVKDAIDYIESRTAKK